ncbi:DUF5680 domain-containing protein [Enterococcus sp. AZ194]|uniref:DUF5680 domain-containing protein n=1 Tax=Enterococcus sp. AZ194 TaxID=2774629 RepID=UPI003F687D11
MENILTFLVKAKRETYANNTGQTDSSRLQSYDLQFAEGKYMYRDSYVGTHSFSGQEIVWYDKEPVWSMNYYGDVLDHKFKSSFLKSALMNPSEKLPYRGPRLLRKEAYTYVMDVSGDFDKFSGTEKIYFEDLLVYELFFHGGKIIDKHFD